MSEHEYEVRISDPGEVAAALPHLLGFRPEESVVVVVVADMGACSPAR